jgi:hypothetical protein
MWRNFVWFDEIVPTKKESFLSGVEGIERKERAKVQVHLSQINNRLREDLAGAEIKVQEKEREVAKLQLEIGRLQVKIGDQEVALQRRMKEIEDLVAENAKLKEPFSIYKLHNEGSRRPRKLGGDETVRNVKSRIIERSNSVDNLNNLKVKKSNHLPTTTKALQQIGKIRGIYQQRAVEEIEREELSRKLEQRKEEVATLGGEMRELSAVQVRQGVELGRFKQELDMLKGNFEWLVRSMAQCNIDHARYTFIFFFKYKKREEKKEKKEKEKKKKRKRKEKQKKKKRKRKEKEKKKTEKNKELEEI